MAQDRVLSNSPQSEIVDPAQALRLTVELLQVHYPKVPIDQLTHDLHRAYEVAATAHSNQWRKSGEPYITHPLAVTEILADLGMNTPTLIAALLHDTIEDTDYNLAQLKSDFGNEVASLVDGVTKLDRVTFGKSAEAETVRKMVVAMAKDIRVLVIKLADRLHNARTWKFVSSESAERKARETLDIYAPLAHRLGMHVVAEGVETFEELAYLQAATRIRYAQGYYFSKPFFLHDAAAAKHTHFEARVAAAARQQPDRRGGRSPRGS